MVRDLGRVARYTSYSGMSEKRRAKNHSFVSKTNKQIKHSHHKYKCSVPNQITLFNISEAF